MRLGSVMEEEWASAEEAQRSGFKFGGKVCMVPSCKTRKTRPFKVDAPCDHTTW